MFYTKQNIKVLSIRILQYFLSRVKQCFRLIISKQYGVVYILSFSLALLLYYISVSIISFGISNCLKSVLLIVFIVPSGYFVLSYIVFIKNRVKRTLDNKFLLDKNKYFNSFLSLLLFYATFFIGLLIFQDKPQEGEIPFLRNDGLIGIRSWQSKVKVTKINIRFQDTSGAWVSIPDTIIYEKNNWKMIPINLVRLKDQIDRVPNHRKRRIRVEGYDSTFSNTSIVVQNCALIFYPDKYKRIFHNIRISCTVTFLEINKPIRYLVPGFQIQSFINPEEIRDLNNLISINDITCLQFNLGMNNNHHPWIPGLDYEPPVKYFSSINKMSRYGKFDRMKVDTQYSISAIIFDNKVLFLGHSDGTVKLFEAEIAGQK